MNIIPHKSEKDQTLDHIYFNCKKFVIARLIFIDRLINIYKLELVLCIIQQLLRNVETYNPIYESVSSTIDDI